MEKISFIKMNGAGNDFILIDKNSCPDIILTKNYIRKLCDRHKGIGADGLITITNSQKYDFEMEYFNADGSTGSLCGNGARCALSFAASRFDLQDKVHFLSNGAAYYGEFIDGRPKFYFNEPSDLKLDVKIRASNQLISAGYINTGSPHIVIDIKDIINDPLKQDLLYKKLDEVPVFSLGREIRYLPDFAPDGTNVNFISISDNKLEIRTYERGVEDETLSCGTGAAASALLVFFRKKLKPPVTLITRGGDELFVDFKFEDKKIKELSLTGPINTSFTGEFSLNNYL